jgi:sugar/nucleoside kinase (ribokinase family)
MCHLDGEVTRPEFSIIGNLNWDLVLNGVDDWPRWGTEVFVAQSSRIPGGIAHGTLAARRQETPTSVVGCVGTDQEGERILATLRDQGVLTEAALRVEIATGFSVGIVRGDGERSYFTYQGALGAASIADLWHAQPEAMVSSRYVLFSGQPLIRPVSLSDALAVLADIRRRGVQSAIDVGWDPEGWPEARAEEVREMFAVTDFVIVNEVEAEALLPDSAAWARAHGCTVALRLGAQGVRLYTRDAEHVVPGYAVTPVDTGGAGDVWNGSFFSALCRGLDLVPAAHWANAAAALYVSRSPGPDRYPTRDEVEGFIQKRSACR